ncbi:MAG: class II fructose-bisphosphate aldolase [Pseudonocardia sp.]
MASGIVKVNIGTMLNVAYTGAVREALAGQPSLVDPRGYLAAARERMAAVAERLAGLIAAPRASGAGDAAGWSPPPEIGPHSARVTS